MGRDQSTSRCQQFLLIRLFECSWHLCLDTPIQGSPMTTPRTSEVLIGWTSPSAICETRTKDFVFSSRTVTQVTRRGNSPKGLMSRARAKVRSEGLKCLLLSLGKRTKPPMESRFVSSTIFQGAAVMHPQGESALEASMRVQNLDVVRLTAF